MSRLLATSAELELLAPKAGQLDPLGVVGRLHPILGWIPALLVGAVWGGMLVSGLILIRDYGSNLPYWEDWDLVPRLTVEKVDLPWLFSQNWEHRVPLPRLIVFILLKATHLDFRSGLYVNLCGLAALALAMIFAARYVRGRTSYADIVFPLLLLNWGHWNNILWNWQVQFICSTLLGGMVLLLILCRGNRLSVGTALAIGICLLLLPMCGANGLALAPLPAVWLGWAGAMALRRGLPSARASGLVSVVLAFLVLASVAGYWLTYHSPPYTPKRLGLMPAVATFAAFIGVGFGRADITAVVIREALVPVAMLAITRLWLRRPLQAKEWLAVAFCGLLARGLQFQLENYHMIGTFSRRTAWGIAGIAATAVCLGILVRTFYLRPDERLRSVGLLCFFAALVGLAAGLGWGRAGAISDFQDTPRYYTLTVILPCVVLLTLEAYGGGRLLLIARPFLVAAALLVAWRCMDDAKALAAVRWQAAEGLRSDLHAGLPASEIMDRHAGDRALFLIKTDDPYFYSRCLLLLRDAGHPEFQAVKDDPPLSHLAGRKRSDTVLPTL